MDDEDLRLALYETLADTGLAPSLPQLAAQLEVAPERVDDGLRRLADARHVVLGEAGQVVMAHPSR